MNQTNVTTTTTISNLTIPPVLFTWPTLARACVGPIAILTNVINVAVFLNPKLKDQSYKYLLFKSIANFFYSLFAFLNLIFNYCASCATPQTYFAGIYSLWFGNFILSPLALYRAILDNILSLYTYCILKNLNWFDDKLPSYKYIASISLLISTLLNVFILFGFDIVPVIDTSLNTTKYLYLPNAFFTSSVFQGLSIFVITIRYFLAVFSLTVLNVLNAIGFRKRYKTRTNGSVSNHSTNQTSLARKQTIPKVTGNREGVSTNQDVNNQQTAAHVNNKQSENAKAIKNIIQMVIFASFLNVLGTFTSIVNFYLNLLKLVPNTSQQLADFSSVSAIILYLTPGLDIFMYYFCNKNYRDVLIGYLKKIFFFFKFARRPD